MSFVSRICSASTPGLKPGQGKKKRLHTGGVWTLGHQARARGGALALAKRLDLPSGCTFVVGKIKEHATKGLCGCCFGPNSQTCQRLLV